jgi:hypothetical protein
MPAKKSTKPGKGGGKRKSTELEDLYEVKAILARRGCGHGVEYLVQWAGCKGTEAEWVGLDGLSGATRALADFEKKEKKRLESAASSASSASQSVDEVEVKLENPTPPGGGADFSVLWQESVFMRFPQSNVAQCNLPIGVYCRSFII